MDELAQRDADAAASPVDTVDVQPVNKREKRSLYAARPRIHPKRARGDFRRLKWLIMLVTLGIYYGTPWIRWDRGPFAPDQAVLIDFPARRFYFFFIEIWPQEFYYVTGLLIVAAMGLFLITSIAGRVWCGYTCPQTVWTDLMIAIERFVEGDRNARLRLDRAPWNARKIGLKLAKHSIWILVALLTGGAWVFYFADAPTLAVQLATLDAPKAAWLFIAIFAATTYVLGALAREQVCTYMCPWPRIQGAMLDEESLVVTYHPARGEPRSSHKTGESWDDRGHCIDCNQCVAVCPMGIDIRDGQQLECIGCALCIDACNEVMEKVSLPRGLISYDTLGNMDRRARGEPTKFNIVRPRTVFYAVIIAVVSAIMLYVLVTRPDLEVNVLHDRNPLFVRLADGSIRNGFTVKILNKLRARREVTIGIDGLPSAGLNIVGMPDGASTLTVAPDRLRSIRVFVTVPAAALKSGNAPFAITISDTGGPATIRRETVMRGPQ